MTAPTALRRLQELELRLDGAPFRITRDSSCCASPRHRPRCRAIRPNSAVTVPGKRNVAILKIEPVGNYAVRITFDDFHDTGIFTWNYLHTLGHEKDERWNAYLAELAEKGLSRDR